MAQQNETRDAGVAALRLGVVGTGAPSVADFLPTNSLVVPLLTDLYELTMAYAYWKVPPSPFSCCCLSFPFLNLFVFVYFATRPASTKSTPFSTCSSARIHSRGRSQSLQASKKWCKHYSPPPLQASFPLAFPVV